MMNDIKNWTEVTRGIYRYAVSPGVCYEIHINYWDHMPELKTANATLFIAGDWRDESNVRFFSRELLLNSEPVSKCVEFAVMDNKENHS